MKIGFLGAGAMGGAILTRALEQGVIKPEDAYVYDLFEAIRNQYEHL